MEKTEGGGMHLIGTETHNTLVYGAAKRLVFVHSTRPSSPRFAANTMWFSSLHLFLFSTSRIVLPNSGSVSAALVTFYDSNHSHLFILIHHSAASSFPFSPS